MTTVDLTDTVVLRDIQRRLKVALDNAARDRELAHRAMARVDVFEARIDSIAADLRGRVDSIAADIRTIRSDMTEIDIKLASLGNIEADIHAIMERMNGGGQPENGG